MTPSNRTIARNVRRWIAALRSGDYTQGRSMLLTNEGKFCCLGVACAVGLAKHTDLTDTTLEHDDKVALGLDAPNGVNQTELIEANDNKRWSFAKIADLLEQKHLPQFTERKGADERKVGQP